MPKNMVHYASKKNSEHRVINIVKMTVIRRLNPLLQGHC